MKVWRKGQVTKYICTYDKFFPAMHTHLRQLARFFFSSFPLISYSSRFRRHSVSFKRRGGQPTTTAQNDRQLITYSGHTSPREAHLSGEAA